MIRSAKGVPLVPTFFVCAMDNKLVEDRSDQEVCVDTRLNGNWEDESFLFDSENYSEDEDESARKQAIVITYEYM